MTVYNEQNGTDLTAYDFTVVLVKPTPSQITVK